MFYHLLPKSGGRGVGRGGGGRWFRVACIHFKMSCVAASRRRCVLVLTVADRYFRYLCRKCPYFFIHVTCLNSLGRVSLMRTACRNSRKRKTLVCNLVPTCWLCLRRIFTHANLNMLTRDGKFYFDV